MGERVFTPPIQVHKRNKNQHLLIIPQQKQLLTPLRYLCGQQGGGRDACHIVC